jgi:D-beta-D-heptose 7-phosphate kinase/D-beta-D-heptose 1-phosphate adenosyltransferase
MDFSQLTVLCVGDVMLDRFQHGDIERISPEAPVPVIRLRNVREMPGGAGNVASNIASLGGQAVLVGLAGEDYAGDRLTRLLGTCAGIGDALVRSPHRPTICKTRFIAGRQQVVRADDESSDALTEAEESALLHAVAAHLAKAGALILSDYGKGVLSETVLRASIDGALARGIPVFVDPKSADFRRYRGATCITPNLKEFAAAARAPAVTEGDIAAAASALLDLAEAEAILVTRSEKGMTLVERGGAVTSVPARAREVFDVSGAGDTVIATMALARAGGRSLAQAMHIANAAAGVVVSKLGTATANIAEVVHELSAQSEALGAGAVPGLQSLAAAQSLARHWRDQGLTVGFTNGCFDIIHPGHVALLAAARRACDRLVVALNSDESVKRLKGATRPVNTLEQRAQVMAAIRFVDCVVGFAEDTPYETIKALMPDVLVKGADYSIDKVVGADIVRAAGGRVVLADFLAGHSTSGIIARSAGGAAAK